MPGASATSRSACTIRSGTTICRTCRFPITGRSTRPRTRWATGSSPIPGSWSSITGPRAVQERVVRRADRRMAVVVERDGKAVTLRPKQLVLATGMSGFPEIPRFPGAERSRASSITRASTAAARAGRQALRRHRLEQLGARHRRRPVGARRRRDHDPALADPGRAGRHAGAQPAALFGGGAGQAASRPRLPTSSRRRCPALQPAATRPMTSRSRRDDAEFYARLEKAASSSTFGEDETGIGPMYIRRGSGYYIDVGASELIADGRHQAEVGARSIA